MELKFLEQEGSSSHSLMISTGLVLGYRPDPVQV